MERHIRVLVGEPHPPTQAIIKKILADNGYGSVVTAADPVAVVQSVKRGDADVALLDWKLVEPGNYKLLDDIVLDRRSFNLPILLMGAGAPMTKVEEALRLGARDYLNKPFTPYVLMVRLEKALYGPPKSRKEAEAGAAASEAAPPEGSAPEPALPKSEAVQKEEARARATFLKGYESLRLRKWDKAISLFAAALKLQMLFPEAYKGLAEAFRGKADLERSSQFMGKAAETLVWLDRHEEAVSLYEHARKIDPHAVNPFKTVADHLKEQKSPQEVVRLYERAARAAPKDPDVAVALARAYVETGQQERAVRVLQPVLAESEVPEDLRGIFLSIVGEDRLKGRKLEVLDAAGGGDGQEKRRALRVPLADYAATMPRVVENFPVVDLSVHGIGFKPSGEKFEVGQEVTFDLVTMGDSRARKIKAVVRRVGLVVIGCEFVGLTPKQAEAIASILPKKAVPGAEEE
ncbi:MAG: response regulator [Thermodesulfobacteriota bacterium]